MTLTRFFALAVGALGLLSALMLGLSVRTSGAAVVRAGESARVARAGQVVAAIESELGAAESAIRDFERGLAEGVVDGGDPISVRRFLTTELFARPGLTELTLTTATLERYEDTGDARLAPGGRRQLSVLRDTSGALTFRAAGAARPGADADPTLHDTFRAAAHRDSRGALLWSDLAFSEYDGAGPAVARRKTMTVQKALFAREPGRFVGVLRAGIVSDTLDRLGAGTAPGDPHRLFLCDRQGRLITRLAPGDPYLVVDAQGRPDPDGDLRVVPAAIAPPIAAALSLARAGGTGGSRMTVDSQPYLLSLLPVAEGRAQQWLVGVVVPENHYVGELAATRDRLLVLLAVVVAVIGVGGAIGTGTVGRGVRALVQSTEAMRRFSFEPVPAAASPFREVRAALASVERAKTALRAMVKYVPVDLVRRLYDNGRDPVLGAELSEISLMFTDIADFTTHAETLSPGALAEALGRYLEAATLAVESTGGTVDKYIGDALMVLWNAPSPDPRHPASACAAALACAAATRALGQSAWWRQAGLPPWHTRFGIHTDRVLVGNFGAPNRLSYTAMGDGVNLAARLEGLNKVYGTTVLVSDEVRRRAGDAFVFRRVDRVAVKGKMKPIDIHELVGHAAEAAVEAARPGIEAHERAVAAAFGRRFAEALTLLGDVDATSDGPARVLAARCRAWLTNPPPADWDGTWTATSK